MYSMRPAGDMPLQKHPLIARANRARPVAAMIGRTDRPISSPYLHREKDWMHVLCFSIAEGQKTGVTSGQCGIGEGEKCVDRRLLKHAI
jgi:hypothetical protein